MFIVRHRERSGAAHHDRSATSAPGIHVIHRRDGRHAAPTQGLLEVFHDTPYKQDFHASWRGVGVIGDSRARSGIRAGARSQIHALDALGVPELRRVGPK
jgi:aspartate carbamoyltransferase catalytic subunit